MFFVDHVDYDGGVIVVVSFTKSEVWIFSKNIKGCDSLLKHFTMNFTEPLMEYTRCCSNRSNQILFFLVTMDEVSVFDLFDTLNFAVLCYGVIERPSQFYFNLTGEDICTHYGEKTFAAYLYKSLFKSLVLQSALIVAKNYTKVQLHDMNLPMQLYKYLYCFSFFFFEKK